MKTGERLRIGAPFVAGLMLLRFAATGEDELVAVGILKDGRGTPGFGAGIFAEGDAFGFKDGGGGEDVITPEGDVLKSADAVFVAFGSEEG
jgi:hypothetical protein